MLSQIMWLLVCGLCSLECDNNKIQRQYDAVLQSIGTDYVGA